MFLVSLFGWLDVAGQLTHIPPISPDGVAAAAGGGAYAGATHLSVERKFWTDVAARAAALPIFLLAWFGACWLAMGRPVALTRLPRPRVGADLAVGAIGWAVVTPLCFGVFFATQWVQEWLGGKPDEHFLSQAGVGESPGRILLFFVSASILAPVYEEVMIRRVLLPWAVARDYRAWYLTLFATLLTAIGSGVGGCVVTPSGEVRTSPLLFAAVLCGGLLLLQQARVVFRRFPVRTVGGVYSTAALFGLLHAQYWPTPVPLFVLGLGLGALAVRTRSVWPAVVAHGLFNAVSGVYLLRSPG
jgi:membrane protease YdiL (CAAX protease family)